MNKIVKNTLILTLITVIAGVLLGAVYEVTKTPIAQSQETAKKEAWQAVFSDVKLDDFKAEDVDQKAADKAVKDMGVNATIDEVCTAGDAGYVITTTDKDGKRHTAGTHCSSQEPRHSSSSGSNTRCSL